MNNIHFKGIPTLRLLDYEQALKFYHHLIGFKIDWEHRFVENEPVYMQISRNNFTIHLSENKRFQTGTIVFIETTGIQLFHQELCERDRQQMIQSIEHTPWGTLQLEIEDPFEIYSDSTKI